VPSKQIPPQSVLERPCCFYVPHRICTNCSHHSSLLFLHTWKLFWKPLLANGLCVSEKKSRIKFRLSEHGRMNPHKCFVLKEFLLIFLPLLVQIPYLSAVSLAHFFECRVHPVNMPETLSACVGVDSKFYIEETTLPVFSFSLVRTKVNCKSCMHTMGLRIGLAKYQTSQASSFRPE